MHRTVYRHRSDRLARRLRVECSFIECILVVCSLGLGACTDNDSDSLDRNESEASAGSGGSAGANTGGNLGTQANHGGTGGELGAQGGSSDTGGAATGSTGGGTQDGAGGSTPTAGGSSGAVSETGGTLPTTGGAPDATGGALPTSGGTTHSSGGNTASTSGGDDSVTAGTSGGIGGTAGGGVAGGAGLATGGAAGLSTGGATEGTAASGGEAAQGTGGNGKIPSDAVPSDGCAFEGQPVTGPRSLDVGGTEREFILRLPEDYDPIHPYPLVFAWHGGQYDAEWVDTGGLPQSGPYFGVQAQADGAAIFVAPQALSSSWTNQDGRDIAFVDAMLDELEGELCIDLSRVFSTGFSMGGIMTLTIGCERGDVFRAIAPMSGRLSGGCPNGNHSVAYWSSHGTSDTTITPANGEAARDEFVRLNHCAETSTPVEPSGCVSYDGCDEGYPVVFCTFDGVHEPAPYAGEEIWGFFAQF